MYFPKVLPLLFFVTQYSGNHLYTAIYMYYYDPCYYTSLDNTIVYLCVYYNI